ncbi:MAG: hypothetical protein JNK48_24585 [Bryobacterales bacterium]|nr:hypothetical protein [Bryobacterales bacterium]
MNLLTVATPASASASPLSLGVPLASPFMLQQWGMEPESPALVMSRPIGAVYLGLSLMLFLGRYSPLSALRSAIGAGLSFAIDLLACLGLLRRSSERVSAGIFGSVVVEIALSAGFASAIGSDS